MISMANNNIILAIIAQRGTNFLIHDKLNKIHFLT